MDIITELKHQAFILKINF